jgi:adenylate cyclase
MFLDKKEGEKELAESLKELKVGFLIIPFETKEVDVAYNDIDERIKLLNQVRFPVDPSDKMEQLVEEVTPPTPDLIKASKGLGFANVFPGRDGINRTVPLIVKFNGWYYPNIDLIIVMHYYGISTSDVEIKMGHYIKLKNLPAEKMAKPNSRREISIPIDEYGFMDVKFIGGSGASAYHTICLRMKEQWKEILLLKIKYFLLCIFSNRYCH